MTDHLESHDPLVDWPECATCHQALSASIANLFGLPLGPAGPAVLLGALRKTALRHIALGAAS